MSISDATKVLSAIPSIADLDSSVIEAIARVSVRKTFDAGQIVFLEGKPCVGMHVVADGWLKSVKTSQAGREQIVRFVGPGETFNDVSIFITVENQATVVALEPAVVFVVRREPLLKIMQSHSDLTLSLAKNLARRVVHLMSLVEDLSLRPVIARLARILLEHSTSNVMSRRRWSTQAEMAARLGTVPDVVHRALRSLSQEGLIEIDRQSLRILDRNGLEAKALLDG